jgi:4'-phosphopantetheinyl transferase EntD
MTVLMTVLMPVLMPVQMIVQMPVQMPVQMIVPTRVRMQWRAGVRCGPGQVTDLALLLAAARRLAPEGVALAVRDPAALAPPLWPGEGMPAAIPKRQVEFAAGRACARAAMALLGVRPAAILHGTDRAPVWPPGLYGSITHSATACLAAVTHAPRLIGLDLEPATPLDPDLWDTVLLPAERRAVLQTATPGLHAKLFFSAKEAAYKAQYLRSRSLLGYDAMEISLTDQGFTARFTADVPGFLQHSRLAGRHCLAEDHFVTLVAT